MGRPRHTSVAEQNVWMEQRIAELEAHNEQLLADKEASPAIIAGYRERGEQLLARIAELEQDLREMDAENDRLSVERFNEGMERAAEIAKENTALCSIDRDYLCFQASSIAQDIRKEIEK